MSTKEIRSISPERTFDGNLGSIHIGLAIPTKSTIPDEIAPDIAFDDRNPPVSIRGTVVTLRIDSAKSIKYASLACVDRGMLVESIKSFRDKLVWWIPIIAPNS